MGDYFEEMNWTPLQDGESPNHVAHFLRILQDFLIYDDNGTGVWPRLPPPASRASVEALEDKTVTEGGLKCPICLKEHELQETVKVLPCSHEFHPDCVLAWLRRTNSCPMCRKELPTDDEAYEGFKKEQIRAKQREQEIEELHNSMFS